jgi:hypothetical protein
MQFYGMSGPSWAGGPHLSHHKSECPIFATVSSSIKVANFRGSENPETLNPIRALGLERYQQDGDSHSVKSATLSHRSAAGDPARLLQGADKSCVM